MEILNSPSRIGRTQIILSPRVADERNGGGTSFSILVATVLILEGSTGRAEFVEGLESVVYVGQRELDPELFVEGSRWVIFYPRIRYNFCEDISNNVRSCPH
jgi:hypothetical protein